MVFLSARDAFCSERVQGLEVGRREFACDAGGSLNVSEPQFPHLETGIVKSGDVRSCSAMSQSFRNIECSLFPTSDLTVLWSFSVPREKGRRELRPVWVRVSQPLLFFTLVLSG